MPSSSAFPTSVSTAAGSGGVVDWTGANNVKVQDGISATASLSNNKSFVLSAGGFGFAIPSDATVTGIGIGLWKSGGTEITDAQITISIPGTGGTSTNKAGGGWPSSNTQVSYGGAGDLWTLTGVTPALVNAGFGVNVQAQGSLFGGTASIDAIAATITWTPGPVVMPPKGLMVASTTLEIMLITGI